MRFYELYVDKKRLGIFNTMQMANTVGFAYLKAGAYGTDKTKGFVVKTVVYQIIFHLAGNTGCRLT